MKHVDKLGCIPNSRQDEGWSTVSVFGSLLATASAVSYYILRIGFRENDGWMILKVLSLGYLLMCSPLIARVLKRGGCSPCGEAKPASDNSQLVLALVVVTVAGMLAQYLDVDLGPVVAATGLLLFGGTLVVFLRQASWRHNVIFLVVVGLFSAYMGIAAYSGYSDPLFVESLAVGRTHLDQLFVSALTAITKTYGIPSTGLDGIPYYGYHWGVFWLFAQLSKLVGMNAVQFVMVGHPVVIVPMSVYAMVNFSQDVRKLSQTISAASPLREDAIFWAILFVAIVGFVPSDPARFTSLGHIESQGLILSLALFFIIASIALHAAPTGQPNGQKLNTTDYLTVTLILPVLLAALIITKISTGVLAVIAYGYLYVRLGLYSRRSLWLALPAVAAALYVGLKATLHFENMGMGTSLFCPFHYVRQFVAPAWQFWYYILNFFWSWVFLAAMLWYRKLRSAADFRRAFRNYETIDLEIILLLVLLGAAPGMVFRIAAGNALYFAILQAWVSVSLLLANPEPLRAVIGLSSVRDSEPHDAGLKKTLRNIVLFLLATFIGALVLRGVVNTCAYTLYRNASVRLCLVSGTKVTSNDEVGCGGKAWIRELGASLVTELKRPSLRRTLEVLAKQVGPLINNVQQGLERTPHYETIRELEQIGNLSVEQKQTTLMFIPHSNKEYWGIIPEDFPLALDYPGCKAVPFIAPALTGVAALDGRPIVNCDTVGFSYPFYEPRLKPQCAEDTEDSALCVRARSKGFDKVIAMDAVPGGQVKLRYLRCAGD
jgi:hypothetical protein